MMTRLVVIFTLVACAAGASVAIDKRIMKLEHEVLGLSEKQMSVENVTSAIV